MQTPAPLTVLGLVALATTAIVCGDTAGKLLTGAGVQPLFVAWSRFALAALLLFWVLGLGPAGLGRLLDWRLILRAALIVGAIASRDFPVLQGGLLFLAVVYLAINLVVDILYAVVDPRVRLE